MRLGTKILLLILAITLGLSAVIIWVVTRAVTANEVARAKGTISKAVSDYFERVEETHQTNAAVVRLIMGDSQARSNLARLQDGDADSKAFARAQLSEELFGGTIPKAFGELRRGHNDPAFHVLANDSEQIEFTTAGNDKPLADALAKLEWPAQSVLRTEKLIRFYHWIDAKLYISLAIPLKSGLGDAPDFVYFVGYRVDDRWLTRHLSISNALAADTGPPLYACFLVNGNAVAQSAQGSDHTRFQAIDAATRGLPAADQRSPIEFRATGENFVGESVVFTPAPGIRGVLAVASSLDQALLPLRRLQHSIAIAAGVVMLIAVFASRALSRFIAKPIEQLVVATHRIAAGQFREPLNSRRRDELGQLARSFNQMSAGLEQRDLIKDTFGKFVSPKLVEEFLADPSRLHLGGQRRVQSVLMSDLENFTALSEKLSPEDLVMLLNAYLGDTADVITELGGIVDKFIADAVVAFWGPPLAADHAARACQAALRLTQLTSRHDHICENLGCASLRARVGIATGEVLIGNIGSLSKYNYTVIGDVANLSSRLEGVNKVYKTQILTTAQTAKEAGDAIIFRKIDTVRVVGRADPVELYEVLAEAKTTSDWAIALRDSYAKALAHYEQRHWPEAKAAFEEVLRKHLSDHPSEIMAARCEAFAGQTAEQSNWDGAWLIQSK
jgi:class 3 adenylate cyclase